MAIPFFYSEEIKTGSTDIVLNEETSRHIVQVLRMQTGERLQLTDGKGNLFTTEITDNHKKKTTVKLLSAAFIDAPEKRIVIAISLIKNTNRFEWFLEKATEIGVSEIIPLICARTEKQHFRHDRMKGILVSAILQSQQTWLPVLHESIALEKVLKNESLPDQRFIAHCDDNKEKTALSAHRLSESGIILIGPEGDFTSNEIETAFKNKFIPVSLGNTRLRTETAGMVAATLLINL